MAGKDAVGNSPSVRIIPFAEDNPHGQKSERAFVYGRHKTNRDDQLRLVVTVDNPDSVETIGLLIRDHTGTDVHYVHSADAHPLGGNRFEVRWGGQLDVCPDVYFQNGQAHKTFTATVSVVRSDGTASESTPYSFEVYNPAAVNDRYRAIADLPAVRGSNLSGFADSIRTISGRIWDNVEDSLKADDAGSECREPEFADVAWVVHANTRLHERYSQAIAYYLDRSGQTVPAFLSANLYPAGASFTPRQGPPYQATVMWQSAVDSCRSYNSDDTEITMLTMPRPTFSVFLFTTGIGAFAGGSSIPFNQLSAGAIACFCDLGQAHLYDDVKGLVQDPQIGAGAPKDWETIEGYARDQVVGTMTLPSWMSEKVARVIQYIYYDATSHAALAPEDSGATSDSNPLFDGADLYDAADPDSALPMVEGEEPVVLMATGAAATVHQLRRPEKPILTLECDAEMKNCIVPAANPSELVLKSPTPRKTENEGS